MALAIRRSEWDRGLGKHAFLKAYRFIYYCNAKYNYYVSAANDSYQTKIFFFTEPTMGIDEGLVAISYNLLSHCTFLLNKLT